MKTIIYIMRFGLILLIFSCGQPKDKKAILTSVTDTAGKTVYKKDEERLGKIKQIEEEQKSDSLRLDKILERALQIAKSNIYTTKFSSEFHAIDSVYGDVSTNVTISNFFSKTQRHLLVRRMGAGYVYLNVFKINKEEIKSVLYHKQWNMEYVNDTVRDVNGDGYFDFVVNWYGSSGCCLKGFSNVYLFQAEKGSFTYDFKFINPTFSPKEKIIRGICYGHPGNTEMYKYKWNGEKVDTLEYIYYEKNEKGEKTGKIISSNSRSYSDNGKILKRLNKIPNEYKKIYGYDWFTGKGYE